MSAYCVPAAVVAGVTTENGAVLDSALKEPGVWWEADSNQPFK